MALTYLLCPGVWNHEHVNRSDQKRDPARFLLARSIE